MFELISDLYSPSCQSISLQLLNRWGTIAVASDDLITAVANSNWSEAQTPPLFYPLPPPLFFLKLAGFRCHFLFGLQSKESNEREQKSENNVRDLQRARFTQRETLGAKIFYEIPLPYSRPGQLDTHTRTRTITHTHTVEKVKKGKPTKRVQKGYAAWTIEAQSWVSHHPPPTISPIYLLPHWSLLSCVGCRRLADWQIESAKLNENDIALKLNSTEMPKTSLEEAPKRA